MVFSCSERAKDMSNSEIRQRSIFSGRRESEIATVKRRRPDAYEWTARVLCHH